MIVTSYSGIISYEEGVVGSKVKLDLIGGSLAILDLITLPEDPSGVVTRFFGAAEKKLNGDYKSPWIYLSDQDGKDLPDEWGARIIFSIMDHNSFEMRIVGEWIDFDKVTKYPFQGWLSLKNSCEKVPI